MSKSIINISQLWLIALISLVVTQTSFAVQVSGYQVRPLVSNVAGAAAQTDPDLINGWGVAFNPDGFVWVADGGTGKSTLYNGDGVKIPLVVTIPGPSATEPSKPTGIVFFGGNGNFLVNENPSRFIFATENGTIAGWAPSPGTPPPTTAVEVVNNSSKGAIYKGLALNTDGNRYLLYAADFHNGKVDVFDGTFKAVSLGAGAFVDPKLPAGFAPFGIQAINGVVFVTYAKQDKDKVDDVAGPGLGFVDAFSARGKLLQRIATGGNLNAPWGLAFAPANFGLNSSRLLVGNFGDGSIVAYDLNALGQGRKLRAPSGQVIHIPGLWGISFGNGLQRQPTNSLFFAAGPNDEQDGLYGKVEFISFTRP